MEIVASYEDEGRSGVHLKNRPALLRLLHDVTESRQFSTVLVYDVSRWGRFQDTDAAAYYEYHCRLHGAAVIYVAEMFGEEVNPITALLKSMKRAMAAEYSRELAIKCRAGQHQVISRGYQIGPLPPLGYRRCSVSADGRQRVVLGDGQRTLAATDRIEWVLASQNEVELVKRICDMYARTRLSFTDISRLGSVEGWRDHQGRLLTHRGIATLVRNEALIGNFVWGRNKHAKSMVKCGPSRRDGCIPAPCRRRHLGSDTAPDRARSRQEADRQRDLGEAEKRASAESVACRSRLSRPRPSREDHGTQAPWRLARMSKAGWSGSVSTRKGIVDRARQRRENGRELGIAIAWKLREDGHKVSFDGRLNVLDFPRL